MRYTCAACHETYTTTRSDEAAYRDAEGRFPGVARADMGKVCEECCIAICRWNGIPRNSPKAPLGYRYTHAIYDESDGRIIRWIIAGPHGRHILDEPCVPMLSDLLDEPCVPMMPNLPEGFVHG